MPSRGTSDGLNDRAKNASAVTSPVPENSSEKIRIGGFFVEPSSSSVTVIAGLLALILAGRSVSVERS
jgi:hypothetical protein